MSVDVLCNKSRVKWFSLAARTRKLILVYVTSLAIRRPAVCIYKWVSPYFSTQTGSEALLLVLQGKNIDTYTIHISDAWVFSIFETFVLFAQALDEGN